MRAHRRKTHVVRRNVRLLILHNALHNMLFVLPVLVPYYKDVIGLGFREFLIGEVVFSARIDSSRRASIISAASLAGRLGVRT